MNHHQQDQTGNLGLDLKLNLLSSPLTQFDPSLSVESSSSWSSAAEEAKSMVAVVGCPNCIMYIIMSLKGKPRCPRCNNKVLVDFLGGEKKTMSKKNMINNVS
ncbi:PREDICTED: uncharacterized protein LOC109116036 [Tarenaya hassleriana]|uniref:uncharacterized protein LOC109116036 n=1 Tax=Tarenaya hassleriana TaxID=28532 RepID=UPI0008FD37B1|nr:PREDICTED: uncharacterized protein LOC109116036 [Tarenaya hassleriana]